MQWLMGLARSDRSRNERGATAIIVALLMVPMLGFTALTVDVGSIYSERRQLQNGADAAALAVAQKCALGSCGDTSATAAALADANANDGTASSLVTRESNSATVRTHTRNADGSSGLHHLFAPILGIDSTDVGATATAVWGNPSKGPVIFPLTFSRCAFNLTGALQTLISRDKSSDPCTIHNTTVPGGFGWLKPTDDCSSLIIDIASRADSDPGKSVPKACKDQVDALRGVTAFFPIFEKVEGNGNNATYTISGFAAFTITGWNFPSLNSQDPHAPSCGNNNCVQGKFVKFVDIGDEFDTSPDADSFGAYVVALTN